MKKNNPNNCPDAQKIEALALGAQPSDENLIFHINQCAFCQKRLSAYQEYYEIAATLDNEQIEALSQKLLKTDNIILKPMIGPTKNNSLRLAAQTKWPDGHTFIRGFINQKEDLVARLMQENHTGQVTLFLIARPEKLEKGFLVRIDGIEKSWLSSSTGVVPLGVVNIEKIINADIYISSPKASFRLAPLKQLKQEYNADGIVVVKIPKTKKLSMTIENQSNKRFYKINVRPLTSYHLQHVLHVALYQENRETLCQAQDGIAIFENIDETQTIHIKIY